MMSGRQGSDPDPVGRHGPPTIRFRLTQILMEVSHEYRRNLSGSRRNNPE